MGGLVLEEEEEGGMGCRLRMGGGEVGGVRMGWGDMGMVGERGRGIKEDEEGVMGRGKEWVDIGRADALGREEEDLYI